MTGRARPRPLLVTVVCHNEETLRQLTTYLDEAGVETKGKRTVHDLGDVAPSTHAVVLFPDDFRESAVRSAVGELRRARPRVFLLVVTREPRRFEPALAPDDRSVCPQVMPKPSFGWTILDAIRARAEPGGRPS